MAQKIWMLQEQASDDEKWLAERVSIIVQGLVRCGGRKAARCILKERTGHIRTTKKTRYVLDEKEKVEATVLGLI